jgi:hypothetical protein
MIQALTSFLIIIACQTAAFAQRRPDTLSMPCASAAGLVRSAGAIVLGTGPNIYDRYVSSRAFCQRDEQIEPRWLATADTRQCFVGYGCERRYGDPANR